VVDLEVVEEAEVVASERPTVAELCIFPWPVCNVSETLSFLRRLASLGRLGPWRRVRHATP
jgi:hypothetical protein